jgi:hypothetical protein
MVLVVATTAIEEGNIGISTIQTIHQASAIKKSTKSEVPNFRRYRYALIAVRRNHFTDLPPSSSSTFNSPNKSTISR